MQLKYNFLEASVHKVTDRLVLAVYFNDIVLADYDR